MGGQDATATDPLPVTGTRLRYRRAFGAAGGIGPVVGVHDGSAPTIAGITEEWVGEAVWSRVLTDDEVAEATDLLLAADGPHPQYARRDHTHALDDLADVDVATPVGGQVLGWDSASEKWVPINQNMSGALGVVLLRYRWSTSLDGTPGSGQIQADTAAPAAATAITIHELDRGGANNSPLLEAIQVGDWFNVFQEANEANFVRYDVTGPPTKVGNVVEVPVTTFQSGGTPPSNNASIDLYVRFIGITNAVVSDDILSIAVVDALPATPSDDVLYLVVGG